MPKPSTPAIERLLPRLRREADGCLVFTGAVNRPGGYGIVCDRTKPRGLEYAHRVMFEHINGPIPDEMQVCHRCDNPPCCEPSHLFAGSRVANAQDSVAKDRQARGERHGGAKLSEDDVRAIRTKHAAGQSCYSLAREYGINAPHAERIVRRTRWRHVN